MKIEVRDDGWVIVTDMKYTNFALNFEQMVAVEAYYGSVDKIDTLIEYLGENADPKWKAFIKSSDKIISIPNDDPSLYILDKAYRAWCDKQAEKALLDTE